jgi:hypothetical protein
MVKFTDFTKIPVEKIQDDLITDGIFDIVPYDIIESFAKYFNLANEELSYSIAKYISTKTDKDTITVTEYMSTVFPDYITDILSEDSPANSAGNGSAVGLAPEDSFTPLFNILKRKKHE